MWGALSQSFSLNLSRLHLANDEACGYACSESTTALLRPRIGQWFFIFAHSSEFCECMNERAQSANNTRPGGLAALFCDSVDQRAYLRSHGAEHFEIGYPIKKFGNTNFCLITGPGCGSSS